MSRGPLLLKENPLEGLFSCVFDTPKSKIKPLIFFTLFFDNIFSMLLNLSKLKKKGIFKFF